MVAGLGALTTFPALTSPALGDPAPEPLTVPTGLGPDQLAQDEGFWRMVARQFINLENGYYGIMPEPVRLAYHAKPGPRVRSAPRLE
jgi:isopenicillin-N epimerase